MRSSDARWSVSDTPKLGLSTFTTRCSSVRETLFWVIGSAFAGYAALELGRHDEAINYLGRAHATNPSQPRTALTYIAALAMGGRMSEARLKLEQLQNTHPHLSHERLLRMYDDEGGRIQTTEGSRRVLAVRPDSDAQK